MGAENAESPSRIQDETLKVPRNLRPKTALIDLFVADGGIHFMHVGRERFEFDLLRVLDEMRIGQIPGLRNV